MLKICLLFIHIAFASDSTTIFTDRWSTHAWGGESLSGTGSDFIQTAQICKKLPILLQKYHCKTMVDAPCGDFYWMRRVDLPIDSYIGIDVVEPLIRSNQSSYGASNRSFLHLDITKDVLPKADLILCRDCFVHFSHEDIARAIDSFKKSGSTYLLTTSFTEAHSEMNSGIATGGWRPLDLRLYPYFFPEPIEIINENCSEGGGAWNDKSLFLWKIEDLPDLKFGK